MLSPDQPAAICDQSSKLNGAGVKTEDKTEGAARGKERSSYYHMRYTAICYALLWLFVVLLFHISNVGIVRYGTSVTFTVGHPGGVHPLLPELRRGSGQHLEVPLPLLPEWGR